MPRTKTAIKREMALNPAVSEPEVMLEPQLTAELPFNVPGSHLCQQEPLTIEQFKDACEEQIRELAYQKWEEAGCPSGDGFDFWLVAEQEIIADRFVGLPPCELPSSTEMTA